MISNEKLNKAGIMDGNKTKLKKFETETAGEYAKRKQFKYGGKACAQLTGWGKARKR
jgi:hypothetical protein